MTTKQEIVDPAPHAGTPSSNTAVAPHLLSNERIQATRDVSAAAAAFPQESTGTASSNLKAGSRPHAETETELATTTPKREVQSGSGMASPTSPQKPHAIPSRPATSMEEKPEHEEYLQRIREEVEDRIREEVEDIKAITMHKMVEEVRDHATKEIQRMVFLTNRQAELFDNSSIHKLLGAFEIPAPKLVIRLHPCLGGPQTRAYGMVSAFKHVPRNDSYTEEWKKVLRLQAENNPNTGIVQDCLPDPPYLSSTNADRAQWQLESFMREVVVPLAAQNNALVIGSAFRDDELMTTFAKVAAQLQDKLASAGKQPWYLFGMADAPSLTVSVQKANTAASKFYKVSSIWQRRLKKIQQAKVLADTERQKLRDKNKRKKTHKEHEIAYDLNPFLHNLVVVDCVKEKNGVILGIDFDPLQKLRMIWWEHFTSKYPCIGIATMHVEGGYAGLNFAASMLHLNVPHLLLDMRIQEERPVPFLAGAKHHAVTAKSYTFPSTKEEAQGLYENVCKKLTVKCRHCEEGAKDRAATSICSCDPAIGLLSGEEICKSLDSSKLAESDIYAKCAHVLFEVTKRVDETYANRLMKVGRADIYEACRLAYFHSFLIQGREKAIAGASRILLSERIAAEEEALQSATQDTSVRFRTLLLNKITDWCTQAEFRAYWELKPEEEKKEILEETGICDFREFYKRDMSKARTAYHALLSDKMLFTAHVKDTDRLNYIVNHKMMDNDGLPEENTLEGLLVLRQAWDLIDIGRYVLKGYKMAAKVCYMVLILLAIAITAVSIEKDSLNADGKLYQGRKMSELITFGLSVATSFVTAIMAFMNPVTRWHQLRDTVATLESSVWLFRTRTGNYVQVNDSDSMAVLALKEQVLKCRAQIISAADVQETSFYKIYPASVFKHDQRRLHNLKANNRIAPVEETELVDKVIIDLEDPESLTLAQPDDHHSPVDPNDYIRLRLYPMMNFYRNRLPRYSRSREVYSLVLLLGSSTGAVLAFVGFASQVAIITAVTSGITAWTEFVSTTRKTSRYNASIVAIENHVLWWDSLSLVEKASWANVESLTHTGETIINAERNSWMSAPKKEADGKEGDREQKTKKS